MPNINAAESPKIKMLQEVSEVSGFLNGQYVRLTLNANDIGTVVDEIPRVKPEYLTMEQWNLFTTIYGDTIIRVQFFIEDKIFLTELSYLGEKEIDWKYEGAVGGNRRVNCRSSKSKKHRRATKATKSRKLNRKCRW